MVVSAGWKWGGEGGGGGEPVYERENSCIQGKRPSVQHYIAESSVLISANRVVNQKSSGRGCAGEMSVCRGISLLEVSGR